MNSTVKPENDIAGTATQRPLLSRDFVLLVAGQGISLFGNVMLRFAMSMWVLDETGSATIFASARLSASRPRWSSTARARRSAPCR